MALTQELRASNCWIFALKLFWKCGGYLIVRKSKWTWVPHVMWAKSIEHVTVSEYKPHTNKVPKSKWARRFPLHTVVFRGRIRTGMGEE